MAVTSEAGGLRLRHGGQDFLLSFDEFSTRSASAETDIETAVKGLAEARFADRSLFVHLVSKAPLNFIVLFAPKGYVPEAEWWLT